MIINKNEYITLKTAALKNADNIQEINVILLSIENRSKEASKKTTQYIMERRKQDKNYCRN